MDFVTFERSKVSYFPLTKLSCLVTGHTHGWITESTNQARAKGPRVQGVLNQSVCMNRLFIFLISKFAEQINKLLNKAINYRESPNKSKTVTYEWLEDAKKCKKIQNSNKSKIIFICCGCQNFTAKITIKYSLLLSFTVNVLVICFMKKIT